MRKTARVLFIVGAALAVLGIICLVLKAMSPEYLDAQGFLHEEFFLLPLGSGLIIAGVVAAIVAVAIKLIEKRR